MNFFVQIKYIQSKMRNQLSTRFSKVEVLINYWNKLFGKLQITASRTNDTKMRAVLTKIAQVPRPVQHELLRQYIKKTRLLHAAAFLQWRLKFPKPVHFNKEEIEQTLLQTLKTLKKDLCNFKISEETLEFSQVPKLNKYKLTGPKGYCINSLEVIGWRDPFDPEKEFPFKGVSDDVYAETRYRPEYSPLSIYIPNNELMFKLMRACIAVRNPTDLWFQN